MNLVSDQLISPVDPFNLIKYEQKNYFQNNRNLFQTLLRPQLIKASNQWSLILRNELFYNDGSPNLENMSNRLVGKGVGIFTGVNLSYSSNFVSFSLEPYYFTNQNKEVEDLNREGVFTRLNDVQQKIEKPFVSFGLRETQLYFHYKELGFGFSNANMWWGPGLHTSLTMTNNTTGFPHIMMGTIREKRYRNVGFNIRYVFSQLDKTENNPYYTALVGTATFYTEPIITIGFNRNMLSSDQSNGKEVSKFDAATILFRQSINIKDTYQTLAAYFILDFPESGLKVFFELGTTDRWQDWTDFLNYPDHGIGSIFGFRQYGLFNNQNFVMGFEYARLLLGSFWEKRPTPNWYGNPLFDYSSYDGRRWAKTQTRTYGLPMLPGGSWGIVHESLYDLEFPKGAEKLVPLAIDARECVVVEELQRAQGDAARGFVFGEGGDVHQAEVGEVMAAGDCDGGDLSHSAAERFR